jgi:hypothetical protein
MELVVRFLQRVPLSPSLLALHMAWWYRYRFLSCRSWWVLVAVPSNRNKRVVELASRANNGVPFYYPYLYLSVPSLTDCSITLATGSRVDGRVSYL